MFKCVLEKAYPAYNEGDTLDERRLTVQFTDSRSGAAQSDAGNIWHRPSRGPDVFTVVSFGVIAFIAGGILLFLPFCLLFLLPVFVTRRFFGWEDDWRSAVKAHTIALMAVVFLLVVLLRGGVFGIFVIPYLLLIAAPAGIYLSPALKNLQSKAFALLLYFLLVGGLAVFWYFGLFNPAR